MYSLSDYLWMVADESRVEAYAGALRALIRPGDHVLDLGAGFGFFSVIAAHAGAAHVHAVEMSPAVLLGPKMALANGCAERITFHHAASQHLALERPADLLVVDVRGPTPFGRGALASIIDARERLLRPGAPIIAATDTVFAAPARTPAVFRREVHQAHGQQGVDLSAVERVVFDSPMRCPIEEDDLLGEGLAWTVIEYAAVRRTDAAGMGEWRFQGATRVDGLALWFESDLGGGRRFSTRPGGAITAYRQMYIPFRSPVAVPAETVFRVHLSVHEVGEHTVWAWRGWRVDAAGTSELVLDQNSLAELVVDPASLSLGGAARTAHPSTDAVVRCPGPVPTQESHEPGR